MAWNNLSDAEADFNALRQSMANIATALRYLVTQTNNHILNTGMEGYTGPISPTVKPAPLDFIQGPPGVQGPPGPQGIQGVPGDFAEPWFDIDLVSAAQPAANEIVLTYSQPDKSPLILRDFLAIGIDTAEAGKLAISGNIIDGAGSSLNIQSNIADIQAYGYINLSADETELIVYIFGINTNLTYSKEEYSYALRGVMGPQGVPGAAPIVQNGTWWYYDETNTLVDSGVAATGPKGDTGDAGGVYTPDISFQPSVPGEFQVTWTGKDLNTIGPITLTIPPGEKGDKGDTGASGERFKPEFSYTITPQGNTEITSTYTGSISGEKILFTYTVMRGVQGEKGDQGIQGEPGPFYKPVATVSYNSIGVNWIGSQTYMPSLPTITITAPIGPQGPKGDKGDPGENLDEIVEGDNISITLTGDTPPKKMISAPQVTTNTQDIATINDILKDRDKWGGVAGLTYTPAVNTLTLINKDDTTISQILPEVTVTYSGLMTPGDYTALQSIYARVESLEAGGVWRGTYNTLAALDAAYPGLDVSSTAWTANDFVYVQADETQGGATTAYLVIKNSDGTKHLTFERVVTAPIPTATNTSLGVVKGTASGGGKVYVETDGSMSVNSWDSWTAQIGQNQSDISNKVSKSGDTMTGALITPRIIGTQASNQTLYIGNNNSDGNLQVNGNIYVVDSGNAQRLVIENDDYSWRGKIRPTGATSNSAGFIKVATDGTTTVDTTTYTTGTIPSAANLSGQAAAFGQSVANGSATTWARSDHYHALPSLPSSFSGLANLSSQAYDFGQNAQNGTATTAARSDHYHALPKLMYENIAITYSNCADTGTGSLAKCWYAIGSSGTKTYIGGFFQFSVLTSGNIGNSNFMSLALPKSLPIQMHLNVNYTTNSGNTGSTATLFLNISGQLWTLTNTTIGTGNILRGQICWFW